MRKKIFHNWGLKLGSVVIAFGLWLLVVQIYDPQDTTVFYGIPVTLTNTELLDQQDKVYEVIDGIDTVRVTVRAPKSVISELRTADIVAEADMSKLTEINTIAISYYVLNHAVYSVTEVLKLNVEDRSSKWVGVRYGTVGEVAEGYMVYSVEPDQTRIEVSGPESAVAQISYASVQIDVTGAVTDVAANVDIQLYDKDDNLLELPGVTKNVNYMRTAVEVLATKEVPISLESMGTPAEGYLATGVIDCEPASVLLAGTRTALENVHSVKIPAEVLDITDATGDVEAVIDLKEYLEPNIRLGDLGFDGRITAVVRIAPRVERNFDVDWEEITVRGVPEGMEAQATEQDSAYRLTVSGLEEAVAPLQQGSLEAVVDVAAWMEQEEMDSLPSGLYRIPATFTLPKNVTVKEPVLIEITVAEVEE